MPIDRTFDGGTLRTTLRGFVTYDEIRRHVLEAQRTATFDCPELIDAREANGESLSIDDLRRAALLVCDSIGGDTPGRRAVIVKPNDTLRLASIFASLVSYWMPVSVFTDPAEAERWLFKHERPPGSTADA